MGIDTTEQRDQQNVDASGKGVTGRGASSAGQLPPGARPSLVGQTFGNLRTGLRELQWSQVLIFGVLAGVLMPFSLTTAAGALSFLAGLVPVGAGLFVGRRVKGHYGLHGFVTGLIGAVVALAVLSVLLFFTPIGPTIGQIAPTAENPNPVQLPPQLVWLQLGGFIAFSLITFATFGASMAGRTEERNRALREQVAERGGQLARPNAIRTLDDLRGLSLPQFGWYVRNLFQKHGFKFTDYKFIDKDKHLDMWLEYEGETWHLRLSVADKVNPGTIEGLNQDLRREASRKGVVITSTEFTPSAVKSAKNHRSIVLIDGPTLFEIGEK